MQSELFYRLIGADRQILADMSLLPVERRSVVAAGLYKLLLGLISGASLFYLASLALGLHPSGLIDLGWALAVEVFSAGMGFFLVWNSYRLMLLINLTHVDEPPDAIRDVSRGFVKILIAAAFGAIFGVPVALALSSTWHEASAFSTNEALLPVSSLRRASDEQERLLFADYLERERLLRAFGAIDAPVPAKSMADPDHLRQQLEQVTQKIESAHLKAKSANAPLELPVQAERGIVSRLEILARHDPLFLGISMALLAFLYSVPVLVSATHRKSAYAYLLAMQNIRCLAGAGIVPRVAVIQGFRNNVEYVRHLFLRAEQLGRVQRARLREMDRSAAQERARRRQAYQDQQQGK